MSLAPGTCRIEGGGALEVDLGVGEVGQDEDLVAPGERHDLLVEIQVDHLGRGVGGKVQHQRGRRRHRMPDRARELGQQVAARHHRHVADRGAGDDEAVGMDRVARIGRQDHVARRGDRLGEVGEALLGAERDHDLGLGVELDPEAARIVARLRPAQPRNAARHRIAMGARIARRLDQLLDDRRRRRLVGIAHAEVDDVAPGRPGLRLHRVDLAEHVRRQAADPVKNLFAHRDPRRDDVRW